MKNEDIYISLNNGVEVIKDFVKHGLTTEIRSVKIYENLSRKMKSQIK